MATPVSDVYVLQVGGKVYAGKFSVGGGSGGGGNRAPAWSLTPGTALNITQSGTLDIRGYASDADGDAMTFTLDAGTLPTGVTFSNGVFTAAGGATIALSGMLGVGADDGVGGVVVGGPLATTFKLTSPTTQAAAPFQIGLGLKMGDATNIVTDLANYQVDVKRRWLDGSAKHVIISGHAPLTASTPLTVNVSAGTPPTGTNLTAADIATAAPSASVQLGSLGTVNLSSLLATPFRTWISGPKMVECHYRADVSGTLLSINFHVRLFLSGKMKVRATVENGYLDDGAGAAATNPTQTYDATVIIGGTTVFTQAALTHYGTTAWMADGWIGGDPQVLPQHDMAYLMASKLVPNYTLGSGVSAATVAGTAKVVNGGNEVPTLNTIAQTYTPMGSGSISQFMGAYGFQLQIGLLPLWDSLCISTHGDSRAWNAMDTNSRSLRSYGIGWRDATTKLPIKPSAFPNWSYSGPDQGGTDDYVTGSLSWENAHHGSGGYLAYLLSGDYSHYEVMSFQSAANYLCYTKNWGLGSARRIGPSQVRSIAWAIRTLAQYAALAPDGDATAAEYRSMLSATYDDHASRCTAVGASPIGIPYTISTYDDTKPLSTAPWMNHFWVSANGHAWDIEPGYTDKANHLLVRDFMYRAVVGVLGGNGSANFCYTAACNYNYTLSAIVRPYSDQTPATSFFQTWGEVWTATFGAGNTACGTTLGGNPQFASHAYWGNLLPAIAYAVDHGATDAATAWARLTAAGNWPDVVNQTIIPWADCPIWGVTPR